MVLRSQLGAVTAVTATTALAIGGLSTAAIAADDSPVDAGITVPKVEGMGENWINGVDVSSVLSLEESGVVFRDDSGAEADLFDVLADHGVNWVRVRVWNEPYSYEDLATDDLYDTDCTYTDAVDQLEFCGYGAGNVDATRATEIAQRATDAGLRVLVNFHYSDFWAHPGQQILPKAWEGYTTTEIAAAVGDYTADTLTLMKDAGVDVGMVQVGNETTGGQIAGTSDWDNTAQIFSAGSAAVRDVFPDAQVAVHFTNPERAGQYASVAAALDNYGVDYDVFLSSYYPYWHGSLENLTSVLDHVATTYDKDVAVAEVSWAHTLDDGDGHENVIKDHYSQYSTSVQGQALAVRDVMQAVANVSGGRGIGTFYWEPAWLPVGEAADVNSNSELWERYGAGWASSYSYEYIQDKWWGGSAWENQAMFDFDGTPLESLRVYEYAVTGSVAPREVDAIAQPAITITEGDTLTLPATVAVNYTDGTSSDVAVTWAGNAEWITGAGQYSVAGSTADGDTVATVEVLSADAGGDNLALDPGFELGEGAWVASGAGGNVHKAENPRTGTYAGHWWSDSEFEFALTQVITDVPEGTYRLSAYIQGADAGDSVVTLTAQSGISTVSQSSTLPGHLNWKSLTTVLLSVSDGDDVTISLSGLLPGGAWGTVDDVSFMLGVELPDAETSALESVLAQALALDRDGYSAASLLVVDRGIQRAQMLLDSPAPSQESVDAATEHLTEALAGLEPGDGTIPDPTVTPVTLTVVDGDSIVLPDTVTVTAYDDTTTVETVVWNDSASWIEGPGTYTVTGLTENGWTATATITVTEAALLINPGFQTGDLTGWQVSTENAPETNGVVENEWSTVDNYGFNVWDATGYTYELTQVLATLAPGTYELGASAHGSDESHDTTALTGQLFASAGDREATVDYAFTGWGNWTTQVVTIEVRESETLTVGVRGEGGAEDYAWYDEFTLVRTDTPVAPDTAALDAALADAAAVDRDLHTAESLRALDLAVERAHVVMGADAPQQSNVDAATAGIREALAALELVPDTTDPTPEPTTDPTEEPTVEPTEEPTVEPTDPSEPDGTDTPAIDVAGSPSAVTVGDQVTLRLSGLPDGRVEVGVASVFQRLALVDIVDGSAIVTVTIPADLEAGDHHLQVRDLDGTVLVEYPITVVAADDAASTTEDDASGELPATGADRGQLAGLLMVSLALAAIGSALVTRRRVS
ncbi:glycosyl hydrolase 53 family protein [Demequina sp. B12]|uniref:glycosyl hydrolase 53 family protein n=1 Tax=Demequina sp. B12 TaxID=2992757 RepID=UPI00237A1BA9|nr:glycosyl hydrolase 53 family protein [Demequina sp. B12]MDE0573907.1 glycosyl hydrolase 53 family protein [Demequina sp. B12]